MATVPRGATIMVVTTIAPLMAICSAPTGLPIRKARFRISRSALQCSFRLRPNSGERIKQAHIITMATTAVARPVPSAAPSTP